MRAFEPTGTLGSMLSLLLGLPAVTVDPDGLRDRKLQAASHGQSRPLARNFPTRRHSVAEIEERQRAEGATVEYIDDLSAALSSSPVFRARMDPRALSKDERHGEEMKPSKAQCPTPVGWCGQTPSDTAAIAPVRDALKEKGASREHGPKWEAAQHIKWEISPEVCGGVPGHFCRQTNGDQTGFHPCPANGGLKNVSKEAAWPHGKCSGPPGPPLNPEALGIEGNTQRCGFSWNDAAAKCGASCPFALASECDVNAPKLGLNSSWKGHVYTCFKDLPPCNPKKPRGECYSLVEPARDSMCTSQCNTNNGYCDPTCVCEEASYGPGAEIMDEGNVTSAKNMPTKTKDKKEAVMRHSRTEYGLANCLWKPGPGCNKNAPYECVDTGKCSAENFFEDSSCETPCLHESLLPPPPYFALWQPGPMSPPLKKGNKVPASSQPPSISVSPHSPTCATGLCQVPHYWHDNMKHQLEFTRKMAGGSILMSKACKLKTNSFVGVSLFSPNYEKKARRLLASCERVGVCCKATLLPADAFGPDAPEGSEEFRFRTIAIKPAFILSQLKTTQQAVVFLDTDLEFHKFPTLFTPGSWPQGDRDVALFNYWGNETNITNRLTPHTGSGVAFFSQTYPSKKLLVAWAEAMAYKHNQKAPDDQVLDLLLTEGEWLKRVSFGWLPAAYMRNPPSYYRGVDCVIDHDHGNPPGLLKHSEVKPVLPPVRADPTTTTTTTTPL